MKYIAIPVTNGKLDPHFGHCKSFSLIRIANKNIVTHETVDAPPHVPGKLPAWLADKGVTDVITGGIGQGAINIFNQIGINVYVGAPELTPEELMDGFLNDSLVFKANYCNH